MNENPYQPPKSDPAVSKTEDPDEGYWSKPSLLDQWSAIGIRGKMRWVGGMFLALNGIGLLFGVVWLKLLGIGAALFLLGFLLPSSIDD
ncbi:MAG: hypothetical protein KDK99_18005 [Verrucomicrobiales bacterium]|nr:hypothetical protein [Verrucomicrobiales bacterium]